MSTGPADAEAASGKSPVEIGNVRIPLEVVHFVHGPMRWLLGVRVVSGTVQADGGSYTVLARSSTGLTWAIKQPAGYKQVMVPRDTTPQDTIQPNMRPADLRATEDQSRGPNDVAAELADDLAYQILSTDAELGVEGLTGSWQAFDAFRRGFRSWQVYDSRKDTDYLAYDSLSLAIRQFRQAVAADPSFAIAHYRLGLALQEDGQQAAAVEAFRASVTANPRFIAAYNALAFALYPRTDKDISSGSSAVSARIGEAHRLWQHVLRAKPPLASQLDRATAYYGLCDEAWFHDSRYAAAYFYCTRAARVYVSLTAPVVSTVSLRGAAANALNTLAIVLAQSWYRTRVKPPAWNCMPPIVDEQGRDSIADVQRSPYGRAALRYYREALKLLPGGRVIRSDPVIRCNAAWIAYADGDTSGMKELEGDPAAHAALGYQYRELAQEAANAPAAARLFRIALDQYLFAVTREPTNVERLNDYAYTVWQWRRKWPGPDGPDLGIERLAERHARAAAALAVQQASPLQLHARSTLGEVLLGRGRAHEAAEVLEALFADSLVPNHPNFDEMRWDTDTSPGVASSVTFLHCG